MKLDLEFDEGPIIKTLIDNVVAKIEEEFHKIFPRLRRDELEDAVNPRLRGSVDINNIVDVDVGKPLKGDPNARCNGNIRPSAYVIKDNPESQYATGISPEGFYFLSYENGIPVFTAYHVLETNNA